MSTEVFYDAVSGLMVVRLAGPASEGGDRRRWQFTTALPGGQATLAADELHALIHALIASDLDAAIEPDAKA